MAIDLGNPELLERLTWQTRAGTQKPERKATP
jgi:hypothetical protein